MLKMLGWFWLVVACSGCAVNGRGLFEDHRTYRENSAGTGRSMTIDFWGINLSTMRDDEGVSLGRTRRTYFFAGPGSTQPSPAQEHLDGSDQSLRLLPAERAFDFRGASPLAIRGRTDGLSFRAGPGAIGITAGIQSFAAIRVVRDSNLLVLIKTNGGRTSEDVFHVKEIK